MFRRRKQSYGTALPSLFEEGQLYCFAFHPPNISKILPRRRGSGSDEVDDEGVETSGKAKSRNSKEENRVRLFCQLPPH